MYILKGLTTDCQHFIKENVPSDMQRNGSVIIEFVRIEEAIAALQNAGFVLGRDFNLLP